MTKEEALKVNIEELRWVLKGYEVTVTENVDNLIFESIDTKKYRYKFKREKTIQTIMGDLTFRRYIVTTRVILMHLQDTMIERILLYRHHLMV